MTNRGAVVITGASTGIGEACALHLDRLGFRVFAGIRKSVDGASLRRSASDRLVPVRLDVTDQMEVEAAARTVIESLNGARLVGLVNNAGIVVASMLEFLPLDALRRQFEVNVVGQLAVTQAFLPSLRRGRGRIVNISSVSGLISSPFMAPYAASKFALEAMSDALRMELLPWKIPVSTIEPGFIQTPITPKSIAAAEGLIGAMPREAARLYGVSVRAMIRATEREAANGASTGVVVKAVVHALTARRPRTRYVVGRQPGFLISLFRALPDRWRDRLILKKLGLM
jgi:NAD(P)-dependent dehydrogenase (short-subunit alcohol dehydrogenase family)